PVLAPAGRGPADERARGRARRRPDRARSVGGARRPRALPLPQTMRRTAMTSWISKALVTATAAVTVVGAVALLLHSTGQPPEGPVDVAWDHDVCAECRMHVGDPRFAAQLHTTDGEV